MKPKLTLCLSFFLSLCPGILPAQADSSRIPWTKAMILRLQEKDAQRIQVEKEAKSHLEPFEMAVDLISRAKKDPSVLGPKPLATMEQALGKIVDSLEKTSSYKDRILGLYQRQLLDLAIGRDKARRSIPLPSKQDPSLSRLEKRRKQAFQLETLDWAMEMVKEDLQEKLKTTRFTSTEPRQAALELVSSFSGRSN